jgi:hypothetical protein
LEKAVDLDPNSRKEADDAFVRQAWETLQELAGDYGIGKDVLEVMDAAKDCSQARKDKHQPKSPDTCQEFAEQIAKCERVRNLSGQEIDSCEVYFGIKVPN